MKHKRIWIPTAGLVVAAAVAWGVLRAGHAAAPTFRHAALERGDIESVISATGKLGAVTTVQVGTQASGQVSAIYADFNGHVTKGQLIARIDPTLQQQAVREAEAGLARNQAELDKAAPDFARAKELSDREVLSKLDLSASQYALSVAKANVRSGQVALDRARRNLAYTSIHAPIDGIVIERNVDVGQTVAASLSAPQLFLIANDLSQLQILASVDESDVGKIHEGMAVHFTVQAAPKTTFVGTVRQLRLQSATTENVVSYTVVIAVENPGGTLLPGMTATVSFLTGSATDVFVVPNAALRIRATPAMLAQAGGAKVANDSPAPNAVGASRGTGASSATSSGSARRRSGTAATDSTVRMNAGTSAVLWYLDDKGKLASTRVQVGITDGQRSEIRGAGLTEGMQVIVGTSASAASSASTGSSPFQQPSGGGQQGPRGGGF